MQHFFSPFSPFFPFAQEMAPAVDWSCLVASIMTATAVVFELSALLIEYSASGWDWTGKPTALKKGGWTCENPPILAILSGKNGNFGKNGGFEWWYYGGIWWTTANCWFYNGHFWWYIYQIVVLTIKHGGVIDFLWCHRTWLAGKSRNWMCIWIRLIKLKFTIGSAASWGIYTE